MFDIYPGMRSARAEAHETCYEEAVTVFSMGWRSWFTGMGAFILLLALGCNDRAIRTVEKEKAPALPPEITVLELVERLVSPVPPKHGDSETDLSAKEVMEGGACHPQVEQARAALVEMGTKIYPELTMFIDDARFSFSGIYSAWVNHSVGDMVRRIIGEEIDFDGYGYKSRANATGSNNEPSFESYAEAMGWKKYAEYASVRTKSELQKEFVKWKLDRERGFGFVDSAQKEAVTGPYLKWLSEH